MKNAKAFTLSEVLITLSIIGVVAALTLPTLISKINDKVFESQRKVATSKLTEAVSMLYTQDAFANVSNTNEFVSKLQSQLKILKICEKNDLAQCLPSTVSFASYKAVYKDTMYNTSSSARQNILSLFEAPAYAAGVNVPQLGFGSNGGANPVRPMNKLESIDNIYLYSLVNNKEAEIKGVTLADGNAMLIGYVPNCNNDNNNGWASMLKSTLTPDPTTILTVSKDPRACIVAMIDVNGPKKPNEISKDIFLYQADIRRMPTLSVPDISEDDLINIKR